MSEEAVLVIDVGTSSIRSVLVDATGRMSREARRPFPPRSPGRGRVEFDAQVLRSLALEAARETLAGGRAGSVAITNQRSSAVVWRRNDGAPVAPAIGWQDTRTAERCGELNRRGFLVLPTQSATKIAAILDAVDSERRSDLCAGTVDTWIAWCLSDGRVHATDVSNAFATGLCRPDCLAWNAELLAVLGIRESSLPAVVDTVGDIGRASALPGAPPIAAMIGDQQASMVGLGVVVPGPAKLTLGTGGMLNTCLPDDASHDANAHGTYAMPSWRTTRGTSWNQEGLMVTAGANLTWLRDVLGLIESVDEAEALARSIPDSGGVVWVPALEGLGTPWWDRTASGAFVGITRHTTRAHLVRAVLEGVAHRAADLAEAVSFATSSPISTIRVDGGMAQNRFLGECLAAATGRSIEVAPELEATAKGAGLLAGVALGWFDSIAGSASTWRPARVLEPTFSLDRDRFRTAVEATRRIGSPPEPKAQGS